VSPAGAVSADVSLCSGLNRSGAAWRCEPAGETVRAGALYYYTRVKSPRDVVVTHRWTRDGRTVQSVNLRVGANPTAGFRTFSRQTVSATQGGTWEVTLLGPGGTVLDRRTFTVRGS
jgi:hypothetical protein